MNEEALNTLYSLAKEEGYSKSFDEFKLLMSSNNEAINTMYNVSKNNGYTKTIDDFKVLVGNKKQQADSNPVKKKGSTKPSSQATKPSKNPWTDQDLTGGNDPKQKTTFTAPLKREPQNVTSKNPYKEDLDRAQGKFVPDGPAGGPMKDLAPPDNFNSSADPKPVYDGIDPTTGKKIVFNFKPKPIDQLNKYIDNESENLNPILRELVQTGGAGLNALANIELGLESAMYDAKAAGLEWIKGAAGSGAADWLATGSTSAIGYLDPKTGKKVFFSEDEKRYKELSKAGAKSVYRDTDEEIGKAADKKYAEIVEKAYNIKSKRYKTGSITEGIKQGDVSEIIGGAFNAFGSVVETMVPAVLTRGLSLTPQIVAPMINDFNIEKAKALYPDLNLKDAIIKLKEDGKFDFTTPAALGILAAGLEGAGIKGISSYIKKQAFNYKNIAYLAAVGSGEGFTEYAQFAVENISTALANGLSKEDAVIEGLNSLTTQEALETFLQGFIGGTGVSVAGSKISSALRGDKEGTDLVNSSINELIDLNKSKKNTTDETLKNIIDDEIQKVTEKLKTYLESNQKTTSLLTEEQKNGIISLVDEKNKLDNQVVELRTKNQNGLLTDEQYDYAIKIINKKIQDNIQSISEIKNSINTSEVKSVIEEEIEASEVTGVEESTAKPETTSEVDNQSKIDEINKKKEESKNNPVKEPKEYAKAVDDYKSTDLGSNEDAKNKKEAVVKQAQTKEGKGFVENQVAQMDYNEDGTITVYRSGTLQEGHNPATTNKQVAEIISSERKKQGLSSDIIEIKIQPSDISAVVPGIESEVFININEANSDRIKKGTKKEQKNKEQLTLEKESVKNELEKTTQALKNAKKAKADGTFKFSDNVYNDAVKKQEAKIKNLEWQLKKYDAELAALETKPTEQTSEVENKKADIERRLGIKLPAKNTSVPVSPKTWGDRKKLANLISSELKGVVERGVSMQEWLDKGYGRQLATWLDETIVEFLEVADIEKRRQEDLKIAKRNFEFLNKEFIPKLEENTNALIEQYDFQKSELLKNTGDLNYVESKYGKTFEDWIPLQIKWLKENKSHLLVDSRNSESRAYKTLRLLQEKNDTENKINVKYDAELAALETKPTQQTSEVEAKDDIEAKYDKIIEDEGLNILAPISIDEEGLSSQEIQDVKKKQEEQIQRDKRLEELEKLKQAELEAVSMPNEIDAVATVTEDVPVVTEQVTIEPIKTEAEVTQEQINETDNLIGGEAEKRRVEGKFNIDGIEFKRNEKIIGDTGNSGEVRFTNDSSVPFKYKIIESENLQPSHEGGRRNPNHFIPEAQPKNRNDKGSLQAEESFASNPRFDELGENTNAYSGAPIVNDRGEVIQGNNRSAGLRAGYKNGSTKYKEDLALNADKFGFTADQVNNMKSPILVREIVVTDNGAIELGNYDVKDLETGGKRRVDPIAVNRRLPFSVKGRISKILFNSDDTLNQSIRKNIGMVMDLLGPYLNQSQRNTILNNNELTDAGAKDLESVAQHFLFDGGDVALPELFESLSYTQKEGIRKALPSIFSTGIDKSIIPELQASIIALNHFQASGINSFKNWLSQSDMFNNSRTPSDLYSPTVIEMAKLINEAKSQKDISIIFSKYASEVNGSEATMFDEAKSGLSKKESIKNIFKTEYNESEKTPNIEGSTVQNGAEQKPTGEQNDTKQKPIREKSKTIADNIRKLKAPIDLRNLSSSPKPIFDAAWNTTLEAIARVVEASGTIAEAVAAGIKALKNSKWYDSLSDNGKKSAIQFAEKSLTDDANKLLKEKKSSKPKETKKKTGRSESVDKSTFDELPNSFKNIDGGAVSGAKLFKRVIDFKAKLIASNNSKSEPLSNQEIIDKTIEFLEKQPEYINESDTYTIGSEKKGTKQTLKRKGLSTQQAKMLSDLQKSSDIRPSKDMAKKIRDARRLIMGVAKGQRDLQSIKRELRSFIRKTIDTNEYSKRDVMDMVRSIEIANQDNIDDIYSEVLEFSTKRNVLSLSKKITDILTNEYVDKSSGKPKAKKINLSAKDRIKGITELLLSEKTTDKEIEDLIFAHQTEMEDLLKQEFQDDKTLSRIEDLSIAIEYNSSLQLDNDNINKVGLLDSVSNSLEGIINIGRTDLRNEIKENNEKRDRDFEYVYEDITGNAIDLKSERAKSQLSEQKYKRDRVAAKKKSRFVLIKYVDMLGNFLSKNIFGTAEALDGLMDRISSLPGKLFGGRTQEVVTKKLDESTIIEKRRIMYVETLIKTKMKEIYGKRWGKLARQNRRVNVEITNQFGDIDMWSQDQMYYMYNMYKDPANRRAFQNIEMFGVELVEGNESKAELERIKEANKKSAESMMSQIESKLTKEIKEFADWQVNELFPELYETYNETYKKINRTNLPNNKFYAGKVYRDGVENDSDPMIGKDNAFMSNYVSASSTKSKVLSSKPIKKMNGNDALATYVAEMEHYAAFAVNIRNINRLFTNKNIKHAIENIYGDKIYKLIDHSINTIANRGIKKGMLDHAVNSLNSGFILAKLAISPVVMVKQLTSTFTYMSDIGLVNWLKYGAKNKFEQVKVWKELRDNSVYLQDRKYNGIAKNIETYSDDGTRRLLPSRAKDFIVNALMYTTKFGDMTAIMVGGLPNYSYYKAQAIKNGKTEAQAIEIAVSKFESDTKRTQQSGDLQDKDITQTSGALSRLFGMFLTTPKQYLRKEIMAVRNLGRKLIKLDRKAGKGTITENLRVFAMYHVLMPVLYQFVASGAPGLLTDWDEEDEDDLIRAAVVGNLNALFIVGDMINMISDVVTDKPWAGNIGRNVGIISIAEEVGKDAVKYRNTTKDLVKKEQYGYDLIFSSLQFAGVPGPTLQKFYKNYPEIRSDNDLRKDILRMLNYSDYTINIKKENKEKKEKAISYNDMMGTKGKVSKGGSKSLNYNDMMETRNKESLESEK